jgi:molybdopterin converting factor subunit 1
VKIRVRLFAIMAQHADAKDLPLELAPGSTVAEARAVLLKQFTTMPWPAGTMLAVNQEYASPEVILKDGDELAIIPPVSGG